LIHKKKWKEPLSGAETRIEILATLSLNQLSEEFNGVMLNATSMNMN